MEFRLKPAAAVLPIMLALGAAITPALAQTGEEMQLLRLYYKDEQLVVSPTRQPKPISQVAENVTVITSREIEEMNAHTLAEVLTRVTGLFVDFGGEDFGSGSILHIQGSLEWHVLVLVDGVRWNSFASGLAETVNIPVGIIERIEVIKGPASSAWGSSLGGVVNVITKAAGQSGKPGGTLSAFFGKADSRDYRAEIFGKAAGVGYYLWAGRQESEGLRPDRGFDNRYLYGKLRVPFGEKAAFTATAGYSEPDMDFGDIPEGDLTSEGGIRSFFGTADLDLSLAPGLGLALSARRLDQELRQENLVLGMGFYGAAGDVFERTIHEEKTNSASVKLTWTGRGGSAVLGGDWARSNVRMTTIEGPFLQSIGVPAIWKASPEEETWAVYANGTLATGRWSLTPGLRYDHNSISGFFTSPSLGVTFDAGRETILRTSAAKGFSSPPVGLTSIGGLFLDPNPDLGPESVWSWQVGLESRAIPWVWLKATLFRHDLKDAIVLVPYGGGPPSNNDIMVNGGKVVRRGAELEVATDTVAGFSFHGGWAYVDIDDVEEARERVLQAYNLALRWEGDGTRAQLFGRYVWWELPPESGAEYDDFVWDLNLAQNLYSKNGVSAEAALTVHNLFNGESYTVNYQRNPSRWAEAGIRLKF